MLLNLHLGFIVPTNQICTKYGLIILSVHIVHIQKGLVGYHLMHTKKKVRAQKKGQHWTLAVHAQDVTIKQTFVT